MKTKRLFLFAAYDKQGIIDDTLMHYLRYLSGIGDIVFVMDNDASKEELKKLDDIPNVLHVSAKRHGEYDFGSYKRCYEWADKSGILDNYDWVYLVNDSVYGPLFDFIDILIKMETSGCDLTGMIDFSSKLVPVQVQSWFVGLSKRVATAKFMGDFMRSVKAQDDKQLIVLKYEVGLSQTILRHGYKMFTFISGEVAEPIHRIYETPLEILKIGLPFLKKNALVNIQGLQYLYPYTSAEFVNSIYNNAVRTGIKMAGSVMKVATDQRPPYEKSYRLTIFSIPIITIYRQRHDSGTVVCYKVLILDSIPVMKILLRK